MKRKERLVSPEYRELLGKRLKEKRIELNFSRRDISDMTTIAENTVFKIEKGIIINIDYYVEYAKSVKYPLNTLTDFKIKLAPKQPLSKERLLMVNLTAIIRRYIIETSFLNEAKTVAEIKHQLIKMKLIDKIISSTAISGVMRNLKDDGDVVVSDVQGRKNLYLKKFK